MRPRLIASERRVRRAPRLLAALVVSLGAALLLAPQAFSVPVTIVPEEVGTGTPVTDFRYLINVDNAGVPNDPDPMLHRGFKPMASASPRVALGDETNAVADLEPARPRQHLGS